MEHAQVLYLDGTDHVIIKNNLIETLENNYTDEQDLIAISRGSGGHSIIDNVLISRGDNATPHRDFIQIDDEGSSNNYETIIANNFLYVNNGNGNGGTDGIRLGPGYSNRYLIYNNIISLYEQNWIGIVLFETNPIYNISARIFNNTILNGEEMEWE